jgi:chemosensory pili system protein ChpA (sensor histidine kinase/response regulator)
MIKLLRTDVIAEAVATEENTGKRVSFASISKRLYRIVRQTGKDLGKKANLELRGTEIELDRGVLEKMTAPFEHLLRNAIAHGLESPQQRESAGKPPIGDIRLSLRQENNEAIFEFVDDGAGLDVDGLRRKAVEMGLLRAGATASDGQVMQLIFAPGLSTAKEVTAISGRGVGMDVVRSEIAALGGRIAVSSGPGEGTCFVIRLPLTHAGVGLPR